MLSDHFGFLLIETVLTMSTGPPAQEQ